MWKLSEISIRNIVSFHEASLQINQGVATLIFGKNEDNAAQPCNGSGKSSLIEAISFALTGEQLRKVKTVEEIINDSADEASVSLCLVNSYDGVKMTINRRISRNAPQLVQIIRQTGPYDTDTEEIVQPTVADYNKYILHEIGLTKNDIYNNFILCDNKYESFLDCSDKTKKEIINNFSNGAIIDESIERLQADMQPLLVELNKTNNDISRINGSISAIENEMESAVEKNLNAKQERANRIAKLEEQIAESRSKIEEAEAKKGKGEKRLKQLQDIQSEVYELNSSDMALLTAYDKLKELCEANELGQISDYRLKSEKLNDALESQKERIAGIDLQIDAMQDSVTECRKEYVKLADKHNADCDSENRLREKETKVIDKIKAEIKEIDGQLDKIEDTIRKNKNAQGELEVKISRGTSLLKGVITCPKCNHQFFLDREDSVENIRKGLDTWRKELESKVNEIKSLRDRFDEINALAGDKEGEIDEINKTAKTRANQLEDSLSVVRTAQKKLSDLELELSRLNKEQVAAQNELDKINGQIEILRTKLFGEVSGLIGGRLLNGKSFIEMQESSIEFCKGQIEQYRQSIKNLQEASETDFSIALKASKEKYEKELEAVQEKYDEQNESFNKLKEQEVNFTIFKSYIARKKIDALSLIVNDFLEKIGSDIRLKLEGFSVTKTGKLRDKISVMVMRDGIEYGSYQKFSGGEKARLNLACILSLHTLVNSNCEVGKGLDFLIIDELLDKSDEMGMSTYCEALNKLGQTALLITQGGVSESYPHKLLITKKHGVSTIQNQ